MKHRKPVEAAEARQPLYTQWDDSEGLQEEPLTLSEATVLSDFADTADVLEIEARQIEIDEERQEESNGYDIAGSNDPVLHSLLADFSHCKMLDHETFNELWRQWNKTKDPRTFDRLVQSHLRYALHLATRYAKRYGMPILDLYQEACKGLLRAIPKFKPDLGWKFGTLATWWMRQAMARFAAKYKGVIRRPVHVSEKSVQIESARHRLRMRFKREPSFEEIIAHSGLSRVAAKRALDAFYESRIYSLESLGSRMEDPDDVLERYGTRALNTARLDTSELALQDEWAAQLVEKLTAGLSALHRCIAVKRLMAEGFDQEPWTLQEIADRFRISREDVRLHELKVKPRIRRRARLYQAAKL